MTAMASGPFKAALGRPAQRLGFNGAALHRTVGQSVEAVDFTRAADGGQLNLLLLARLESDGRSRGNVEMHAECGGPVEFERSICFEKMIVAADLDRPVSCILDAHGNLPPPGVNFDVAAHRQDFARPDPVGGLGKLPGPVGSWTVTGLVPSGNVPSNWNHGH